MAGERYAELASRPAPNEAAARRAPHIPDTQNERRLRHVNEESDEGAAPPPITQLLRGARAGRGAALDALFARLYAELRSLAHQQLRRGPQPHGLNTTGLVHEAYLRFASVGDEQPDDRQHFLAYASTAMRSVVVDSLRADQAAKRGGGAQQVTLNTDIGAGLVADTDETLRIHDALLDLGNIDAQLVQIVEMRFFGGLSDAEIAGALGMSLRTVQRHWQKARLFLYAQLNDVPPPG